MPAKVAPTKTVAKTEPAQIKASTQTANVTSAKTKAVPITKVTAASKESAKTVKPEVKEAKTTMKTSNGSSVTTTASTTVKKAVSQAPDKKSVVAVGSTGEKKKVDASTTKKVPSVTTSSSSSSSVAVKGGKDDKAPAAKASADKASADKKTVKTDKVSAEKKKPKDDKASTEKKSTKEEKGKVKSKSGEPSQGTTTPSKTAKADAGVVSTSKLIPKKKRTAAEKETEEDDEQVVEEASKTEKTMELADDEASAESAVEAETGDGEEGAEGKKNSKKPAPKKRKTGESKDKKEKVSKEKKERKTKSKDDGKEKPPKEKKAPGKNTKKAAEADLKAKVQSGKYLLIDKTNGFPLSVVPKGPKVTEAVAKLIKDFKIYPPFHLIDIQEKTIYDEHGFLDADLYSKESDLKFPPVSDPSSPAFIAAKLKRLSKATGVEDASVAETAASEEETTKKRTKRQWYMIVVDHARTAIHVPIESFRYWFPRSGNERSMVASEILDPIPIDSEKLELGLKSEDFYWINNTLVPRRLLPPGDVSQYDDMKLQIEITPSLTECLKTEYDTRVLGEKQDAGKSDETAVSHSGAGSSSSSVPSAQSVISTSSSSSSATASSSTSSVPAAPSSSSTGGSANGETNALSTKKLGNTKTTDVAIQKPKPENEDATESGKCEPVSMSNGTIAATHIVGGGVGDNNMADTMSVTSENSDSSSAGLEVPS